MLLNPDPKRRAIQLLRTGIAVAIFLTIIIGSISSSGPSFEMDRGNAVSTDGLYLVYDGNAYITNTYNTDVDSADVTVSFNSNVNDKRVPLWSGTVSIPANSTVTIPISFRVSIPALTAAAIMSIKNEGSPIEAHFDIDGRCMFGLLTVTMSFDMGIHLAKGETTLQYEVIQNDNTAYRVDIMNIADRLLPKNDTITMISGGDELEIKIIEESGTVKFITTGGADLEHTLNVMRESVDSVTTESGMEIETDTASAIADVIYYARQIL